MGAKDEMSDQKNSAGVWQVGQWVAIEGMPGVAQLLTVDVRRRRARVLLHNQEWVVALKRLSSAERPRLPESRKKVRFTYKGNTTVRHEIDLHGMRVEDALGAVDYALDQAVVHHLTSLKIIHGYGTGAVRMAVREMLETHPHVAYFRFGNPMEGGLACTIAELRMAPI